MCLRLLLSLASVEIAFYRFTGVRTCLLGSLVLQETVAHVPLTRCVIHLPCWWSDKRAALSYHVEVTACTENELVEGHRWQEQRYFCSWLHLRHCLEDDWFMHIMSQSSPIQNKWKGYMWRLRVKRTTDETVCYEIWIKKEKDSVKRWPFPPATSFWWFISSSLSALRFSFNSNYLSLGHQVDTFCDASPRFLLKGCLLLFRVAHFSYSLVLLDATTWIKSLF